MVRFNNMVLRHADNSMQMRHTITGVIEAVRDCQLVFELAESGAAGRQIQHTLARLGRSMADLVSDLLDALHRQGEVPGDGGGIAGSMHRGWVGLREALARRDDHAVLAECERVAVVAVDTYRLALRGRLPPFFTGLLEAQCQEVRHARDCLRKLRAGEECD